MNDQRDALASAAGLGHVDFRLLGPLEALVEGEPVPLGAPKQRALLAHLLLRANVAVPVERLVDALWPEDPPATARHAIQVYVSRLRQAFGDPSRVEVHSRSYLLRADTDEVDLGRFRLLVAEARDLLAADDANGAVERLDHALALWRDRPLVNLEDEPGVRELVLELEEERVAALELRIAAKLHAGESAELVPELERLVGGYPAREQLHADLMLALYRADRKDDALEAYRRAAAALLNELGLEPSPRLSDLEAAIRSEDPALTVVPSELRGRRHLPAQPNQFIGREREVEEIVELIAARGLRLVTLTGTGGIGKTRLALEVAERLLSHFEDGVWFVDLAPLSAPDDVARAVTHALGVVEAIDLEAHLVDKRALLLVDNLEHLAEAAPWLGELLERVPHLAVLATSRSPLHVADEHEYKVPPLTVPGDRGGHDLRTLAAFEAVRLLATRARAVARTFELTEANGADVAGICVALDGLPLAIELAGATLKRFSPSELRVQLEQGLPLLVGGPVDAPARQQTIRATIEWSHGLLAADERLLFARLAVFSGGWTAEAAREVCGADKGSLRSLREQGLIQHDGQRFAMLTTIREFALEQPEPRAALARRHAEYFAGVAEAGEARAHASGRSVEAVDEFGRDYENFRAALRWTHDSGETDLLARLADGLSQYWHVRGPYAEARHWLEAARDARPSDAHLRARIAYSFGQACMYGGDYVAQRNALEGALPLFRSLGDRDLEASCLGDLGVACLLLGDYEPARRLLTESQGLAREAGDDLRLARIANCLGALELMEERLDVAEHWFEESLHASESVGDQDTAVHAVSNLGFVALRTGRVVDAASHLRKGLRAAEDLQHSLQMAQCVQGLAAAAAQDGELVRAGRLLGICETILEDSGGELLPFLSDLERETQAAVQEGIGAEGAVEAFEVGRSQRRSDALAYALQE